MFIYTYMQVHIRTSSSIAACTQYRHIKQPQTSTLIGKNEIHIKSAQLSTLCLESFNDMCGLSGAQEPREGVLGHQTVDLLLGGFESVGTHRVHHAQQSLAGFCIQVYLRAKVPLHHCCQAFVLFCLSAPTSCGASGLMNWLQMLLALVLEGASL